MEYDEAELQEAVLALLGVFEFETGRVWKRYDFSVMEALHEQGWITDPHGLNESNLAPEVSASGRPLPD